jgi:hypothetical protein
LALLLLLAGAAPVWAQGPTAPREVRAEDTPDDAGNSVTVSWQAAEPPLPGQVFVVERRSAGETLWNRAGEALGTATSFVDAPVGEGGEPLLENGLPYEYRVVAVGGGEQAPSAAAGPVRPETSWFIVRRWRILSFFLLFLLAILVMIESARRGRRVYIRPIAGLKALEEAVGRATEMGKPVFFMPGIDEANNIQTLYGMVILQHVTRLVARYETPLIVVVGKAFVVPLAQETVKQGYLDAGRPELYKPDGIRYYSDEQFATVTAVVGIFLRERPATNLYFGSFYAESLILAETGFATGAIQIAGTGNIHQLPFFVVACDYALVGEEFFAVSAYLAQEPRLLGSLKAMDLAKAAILAVLTAGFVAATFLPTLGERIASWFTV